MVKEDEDLKCAKCNHEHIRGEFCPGCANDEETDDAYKYISCNWRGGTTNYNEVLP